MKDLDFDELDRAVNSLMTNVPKTPEPKKTDDNEQTLTITPTLKDDDAPSFKTLDKTVAEINNTPTEASDTTPPKTTVTDKSGTQPLAARRGRFMDMVRPGASPRTVEPTRPTSRQGTTIEPAGPLLSDIVTPSMPSGPSAAKNAAPSETNNTPAGEWPDPIEMTSTTDPVKVEDETPADEPAVDSKVSASVDTYTPLTTPFLTDTKVEKRPLGGAVADSPMVESSTPVQPSVEEEKTSELTADEAAQLPADPTEIASLQLPEELSGDLVALEADANTTAMKPEDTAQAAEPQPSLEKKAPIEPKAESMSVVSQSPVSVPDPEEKLLPPGPISIPQQYREEPSTGDTQSGSIYDTDTYHQPLSHPAKKKSGWMWVIWIIAILLVGAGCGAVFYFMNFG